MQLKYPLELINSLLFISSPKKAKFTCRSTIDSPPQRCTFIYSDQSHPLMGIQRRLEQTTSRWYTERTPYKRTTLDSLAIFSHVELGLGDWPTMLGIYDYVLIRNQHKLDDPINPIVAIKCT